jgi:hypothetical protein
MKENSFVSTPVKPFTAYDMIQTGKTPPGDEQLHNI